MLGFCSLSALIGSAMRTFDALGYGVVGALAVVVKATLALVGLRQRLQDVVAAHLAVLRAGARLPVPQHMLALRAPVSVPVLEQIRGVDAEPPLCCWRSGFC